MVKIMLVIDNDAERVFLEKVLSRLQYEVISMTKGSILAEQLLDHFPDVVFAATLGKNQKILTALAKIKEARGKPKVVFVRQEREAAPLNADQKKVIDGVIYSPIDPFKLIEILSHVTQRELQDLRKLYNEMLQKDRTSIESAVPEVDEDSEESSQFHISSKNQPSSPAHGSKTRGVSLNKSEGGVLIIDFNRKQKYQEICNNLKKQQTKAPPKFNANRLRELQKKQSENISEDPDVKANRKHFLKTLFTMEPKKKKES